MSTLCDANEVYRYIGGVLGAAMVDPDLGPQFAASGVVLKLNYKNPEAVIVVDFPSGKLFTGDDCAGVTPDIEMFMAVDVAHKFWLGRLNASAALAKGQARAKGSVPKLLKLVGLCKQLFPRYEQGIRDAGRDDLLTV